MNARFVQLLLWPCYAYSCRERRREDGLASLFGGNRRKQRTTSMSANLGKERVERHQLYVISEGRRTAHSGTPSSQRVRDRRRCSIRVRLQQRRSVRSPFVARMRRGKRNAQSMTIDPFPPSSEALTSSTAILKSLRKSSSAGTVRRVRARWRAGGPWSALRCQPSLLILSPT